MGERCTIGNRSAGTVLYLHWNSTPEEVTALLDYCAIQGYRTPRSDPLYGMARLCQTACNTWGNHHEKGYENGLSVGIAPYYKCEEDYGHYELDGWFIEGHDGSGRFCYDDVDIQNVDESLVWKHLKLINSRQPDHVWIDEDLLYTCYCKRSERRDAYLHGDMQKVVATNRQEEAYRVC